MECFLQSSTNFPDRLGRPKERKEKTKPHQELFSTFHQPEAGSKLCRAGTLQTTAHTQEKNKAPEPLSPPCAQEYGASQNQNPAVSQRCQAGQVHRLQASTAPHKQQLSKGESSNCKRQGMHVTALLLCILCINRPCQALP